MRTIDYTTSLPGASHWSLEVRRGSAMRLTDISGDGNVGMLFYNPRNLLERYNAPDSLKCQHTFKLTAGHCLYSDMGRIFASITHDSFGWHDTVAGTSHKSAIDKRWGKRDYQSHGNQWLQNGFDAFLVELAKYGLGRADIAANLNWFSKVATDDNGAIMLDTSARKAGATVDLRFEMDTLVVLHTCPHPLDASEEYPRADIRIDLGAAAPIQEDDLCLNSRPENARGFANNALYHIGI
ncbi:urea carboxylase-associated family protein [Gilvimarinus sp. SDUM040013]|uniref:Urea carboxylase-associated family protein n=1 Tax=Gilvimarinus gilvus TaxID=3058038 RepID=A0ABU4RUK0_9GAMM|nr:urea amidolyase associated protein UAAP1 [Gilvimarinus sp. SDUM040013]MDO3386726.1 urea carboxylase-associated family protein [Gilvimarinus sp. SDUM040013]MDX6848344.1 urea carboxylase-associated family protein [Gilvimarinus sp. SDUM040013]